MSLKNFDPIPVRDFTGNGKLVLTDGHTRTYIAWKTGIKELPAIYDNDIELVSNDISLEMYINCIKWCERLQIKEISNFSKRVLSEKKYKELWEKRCDKMHNLVKALKCNKIDKICFKEREIDLQKMNMFMAFQMI